jgi:UDP-N-acetylglucosamine--N-acetylmuramyl-(pentapeptide) pyrophosphoryl-undecaprenol N-acetylglucosamine transferase
MILTSGVQLIWQTGRFYYKEALTYIENHKAPHSIQCADFITRMDYAYAAADLVISRAGAGTISELCLLAKPLILVPSPNVAEDHQTKNAMALVEKNAAIFVSDKDAKTHLIPKALEVIKDEMRLLSLSNHIATLAQHRSAERIADEVIRIIERSRKVKYGYK